MKRGILLVLIGLLLVGTLVGCGTYRRNVVTTPDNAVTHGTTDGVTRGSFRYRNDGQVVDGRTHRRAHRGTHGYHGTHNFRYDGRVTDTDGIIGDGTHADRPPTGHRAVRRGANHVGDGVRNATWGVENGPRRMDGVITPGGYRNDAVTR